ncbi:MAG: DUF192 domain-containing protein [Candidatus Levybacteria bacterium]|nr:DUF192 domain-containing protein [Candidatus Levybacteria bacterium]
MYLVFQMQRFVSIDKSRTAWVIIFLVVELKVKILKNFKEKAIGLLSEKKPFPVLIRTRFGIHTFGLRFPIDVLVLDKFNKVVKISENLKPNRVFFWNPLYSKVIELPKGEIRKSKIKIGETIRIKYKVFL